MKFLYFDTAEIDKCLKEALAVAETAIIPVVFTERKDFMVNFIVLFIVFITGIIGGFHRTLPRIYYWYHSDEKKGFHRNFYNTLHHRNSNSQTLHMPHIFIVIFKQRGHLWCLTLCGLFSSGLT